MVSASRLRPTFEDRLRQAARELWDRAPSFDQDGADPTALCEPLRRHGLFLDVLPEADGGVGLADGAEPLRRTLLMVGAADLSAGRIFEGHVNAVKLVGRYGDPAQRARLAADVREGAVAGVWNAEAPPGLALDDDVSGGMLRGRKIYCSGVGLVSRPIVTARTSAGPVMVLLGLDAPPRHDLSGWTVRGMRATATGTVELGGHHVEAEQRIGAPSDYYRAPFFKGGAWRFAAVQTGAVLRLLELFRRELKTRGRDGDLHQRARLGAAAMAAQTAELWVARAAEAAEGGAEPTAAEAYVNLARLAVERAALEVIALVERGLGLSAFTRPSPVERVVRDLSTYLRQPFPDGALDEAAAFVADGDGEPPWSEAVVGR